MGQTRHESRILIAGTWNVAWKKPMGPAGRTMRERLMAHEPEVLCLTEADGDFMQGEGHTISAEVDYGYPIKGNRRKVLLWSRNPWEQVDQIGEPNLPSGASWQASRKPAQDHYCALASASPGPPHT